MGLFDNIFKRNKKNQGKTGREPGKKVRSKATPTIGSKSRPKSSCKNNQGSSYMARDNQPESTLPCSPTLLAKVAGKGRSKSPAHNISVDLDRELATPHLMPSSLVTNAFNRTYDCVAFLIHCPTHLKICAAKSPTGAVWLPYVQKPEKTSWYGAAQEGAMHVLSEGSTSKFQNFKRRSPFNQMLLLEMARVQMPNTNKFVERFTFYMRLKNTEPIIPSTSSSKPSTPRSRPFVCCVDTPRLMWLSLDYICEGFIPNCWGPELVDLSHQVAMATNMVSEQSKLVSPFTVPLVFRQRLNELGVEELFDILPHRDTAPSNNYMESLKQIKTSEKGRETERLFNDFLDHCFPSFYMPYDSFRHYFRRNNFETSETRLKRLFNVFNRLANGFLSFPELAMGLICIERETPHVEFRIKFLFDYYDTKKRGALNEDDFTKMVRDMNVDKHGKIQCTDEKITRTAREAFAKFRTKIVQERASVTYPAFLAGIGTHVFRGTSTLVRSKRNVFACISRRLAARAMKTKVVKGGLANMVTKKNYLGSCQTCKTRQYKMVSHLSIITPDGYCSEQIEALEMPVEVEKYPSNESDPQMSAETSIQSVNFVSEPTRTESSAASFLLATIRQFNENKPRFALDPSQPMSGIMTGPGERETLVKLLHSVADEIIPLLASEPRCKPVPSPAFLIGDIHGNLEDLISLEKTIWKRFPEVNGMHYLFLGDYVDRGRYGVECAVYLMAMKLLRPGNIHLLRGNHEVRDIQAKYTFRRECLSKFGEEKGIVVWDLCNRIFDYLPLCAVVDDNVFCAHGGIPHSVHTISEINNAIPVDLINPEQDCEVAWEIMWSDPMIPESFADCLQMVDPSILANLRPGYLPNHKRGAAFYWNDVGNNDFLVDNQLAFIIRAHEVPRFGFMFHFNFKCTTIFSCSHYCGNENESSVILLDSSLMRVIRIDTSNNMPATE